MDGVRWVDYQEDLENRLCELHRSVQQGSYRPKPAMRVFIPKEDGGERPLNIICLEDKIVQQATVMLLNQIYEVDFLGFSYGFRPERSQHDALDALGTAVLRRKVNWILDLDIRKFFDSVEHSWLIRFIEHRIEDRRLIRLIRKWLEVGVLDEHGHRVKARVGTPQGAVVSPILANIYLHYAFDLWAHKWRKQSGTGEVAIVRYADDGVLGFQRKSDAERFLEDAGERLASFGLELHPDKTRLIRFGRFADEDCRVRGEGRPNTFDFLGFTHICGKTRKGKFCLKRKTARKKLRNKLKEVSVELRRRMHDNPYETARWLRSVVQGHINYYGVPFNSRALSLFHYEIRRRWYKKLCRRSQKKRITWASFGPFADRWIPVPRIVHPYPVDRFLARTRSRNRMR